MTCSPADLVLIPFPFADLPTAKMRPVFVLTEPDRHGDFVALAVTTVPPVAHGLRLASRCLVSGALPRQSWVRLDKIFTLSANRIVKTFGQVTPDTLQAVLQGLCMRVGFTEA